MAVIGKIRQRSGMLIFLIGLSIVLFLVMDATNSQTGMFNRRKDTVGVINGEKIPYLEFNAKYEENLKSAEEQLRGQAMTEDQRNYLRSQTWNEMISELLFKRAYENLGINVTAEELSELATSTENASSYLTGDPQFKNPQTGQFDPSRVRMVISSLSQQGENAEATRAQWLRFEKFLKQNQYQEKYSSLINKGLYVPGWMAEMAYNDQMSFADARYVVLPYNEVNDADVKVTDDDLKAFIAAHPNRYKVDDETRKLQFVTFDVVPSAADTTAAVKAVEENRAGFAESKTTSDDSSFVKVYSESAFDDAYYDKDRLVQSPIKDSLFNLPVKSLIGPYIDGNSVKIAKITDRKLISDSVHVRELVISFANVTSQDIANQKFALMDSIVRMVDTMKQDFGFFAATFSDDATSKMRGGDIGWVKQGEKEKLYNDQIFFRAQKGKIYRIPSQQENAFHLVQVVEDRPSKTAVQVAYLTKEILPSPETERTIYGEATAFASANQAEAKFVEAAKKLNVKQADGVKREDFGVQGLGGAARDLVKWAYGAKKGEVSPVYQVGNKHVIALLENVRAAGVPEVDAVREPVKQEVIREKKFELLAKKITDAKSASIDELAGKLGKPATDAAHLNFGSSNLNNGYEPAVIGAAFNPASKGKVSAPVKGNLGVFAVQTNNLQEAPKQTDYTSYKYNLSQQLLNKSRSTAEVQKKMATIVDDRAEFF